MAQPVVKWYEPSSVKHLRLHTDADAADTLIKIGDLLRYESGGLGIFDTAAEDTIFVGVALGGTKEAHATGSTGDTIPVALRAIVEIDLTSGDYTFGQDLMYTSKNALVDASANAIAFFFEENQTSITRGDVWIDVMALGKLFTITA